MLGPGFVAASYEGLRINMEPDPSSEIRGACARRPDLGPNAGILKIRDRNLLGWLMSYGCR